MRLIHEGKTFVNKINKSIYAEFDSNACEKFLICTYRLVLNSELVYYAVARKKHVV